MYETISIDYESEYLCSNDARPTTHTAEAKTTAVGKLFLEKQ